MSIASELQDKINSKAAIKAAIEAKGVTVGDVKLNQYASKVDAIAQDPSIPVGTGQHLVTFYDFDGKVLKRQRVNTGEDATAPATPTHQYLTFAEWNNPFTNVKIDIDTGAIYNTTNGKTYLFITLTPVTGLAPTLYYFKSSTSLMTIDWGDGTTSTSTTSGNQTVNHVYATAGDYIITVDNSRGGEYYFGDLGSTNLVFGTNNYILTKLYIGKYHYINSYSYGSWAFYNQINFNTVSIGKFVPVLAHFRGSYLKHINLPSVLVIVGTFLYQCPLIEKVINSSTNTTTPSLYDDKNLWSYICSSNISTIQASTFLGCISIKFYIFLSTTPPTLANINAFSGINPICKIYVPDASVEAYKTATNWVTYANYIYPLSQKPQSNE